MLFRKLWRTMRLYKAQFLSMILMTTLGLGVFVGFHMEWYTLDIRTASFYEETGFADYRVFSETGFSEEDAEKAAALDGVDGVSRFFSTNMDVTEQDTDTLALSVTENQDISSFLVTEGSPYDPDSTDGIWLSDQYAAANGIAVGDSLTLSLPGFQLEGEVKGLGKASEYMICVRDASQLMPNYQLHGFAYISPAFYEDASPMPIYPALYIRSDLEESVLEEQLSDLLGYQPLLLPKSMHVSYAGPQGEVTEGQTMATLMPTLFLLIAVLSMITTMHRITSQEKVQIGTLKALGFHDKRILRHYTSYALTVGIIGTLLGSALGYFLCGMIMGPDRSMGAYLDMPDWKLAFPLFCIPIMLLILLGLSFIGYLSVRQQMKGTAADALRPYTPKEMKPLRMEQFKWFHRLSFGSRWNMRDSMRHKARSFMSVFGVLSCVVIIYTCLGMRDSVNAYVTDFYYPSMSYETRLYLKPDAPENTREALREKYGKDTSQTIGVKLEEQAVSLHLYHLEQDSVIFVDQDMKPFSLGDDGAYVCMRIADQYGCKAGDTITISPYGTDDTYTLKIAGLLRSSMQESIVLSDRYAEKIGIEYLPDSIYSNLPIDEIDQEDGVESLQSRQSITSSFDSFLEIMNSMLVIFIEVGIVLGIVVLYNLGVMTYMERYRELATLKVVGFRDRQINHLLHGQALTSTIAGIALGLPIGYYVLVLMMNELAAEYEMLVSVSFSTYLISIALTFGVSVLVSFMTARKNKKIDMVAALKDAE